MKAGHRKDAQARGGHGRHMENLVSRATKRRFDRRVDKRRRQEEQHNIHQWVSGITEGD